MEDCGKLNAPGSLLQMACPITCVSRLFGSASWLAARIHSASTAVTVGFSGTLSTSSVSLSYSTTSMQMCGGLMQRPRRSSTSLCSVPSLRAQAATVPVGRRQKPWPHAACASKRSLTVNQVRLAVLSSGLVVMLVLLLPHSAEIK